MTTRSLLRGMGTFFKACEHPKNRWSKCPHEYKIRYRNLSGHQTQESGFTTQDAAINRLTEVYRAKRGTRSQSKAEHAAKYGRMTFSEYAAEWRAGQRHLAESSIRQLDSLLGHHLLPFFGSRRMDTFDHKVVDEFVRNMEAHGVGSAAQSNAFDKLATILLDAYRLGIYEVSPIMGSSTPNTPPGAP